MVTVGVRTGAIAGSGRLSSGGHAAAKQVLIRTAAWFVDRATVLSAIRPRDLLPGDERLEHQLSSRNRHRRIGLLGETGVLEYVEQTRHGGQPLGRRGG